MERDKRRGERERRKKKRKAWRAGHVYKGR